MQNDQIDENQKTITKPRPKNYNKSILLNSLEDES